VVDWRVKQTLLELLRIHHEKVMNHFLMVCSNLSSCFVTGEFWLYVFAKEETLDTAFFVT